MGDRGAWERYVETGTAGITDEEREALVDAFHAATEAAADSYRKGES